MVWSIWWQDCLKVFLPPLPAHFLLLVGRPLQQPCCKLLVEMPQLQKNMKPTNKQTPHLREIHAYAEERLGMKADFRGETQKQGCLKLGSSPNTW